MPYSPPPPRPPPCRLLHPHPPLQVPVALQLEVSCGSTLPKACVAVSSGETHLGFQCSIKQQRPARGFARWRRAAETAPRVCKVASIGSNLPESVQGGVERRNPVRACPRVCESASSGGTRSEGVQGSVKRLHPVRGCARRCQAAAHGPRVFRWASRGDAPFVRGCARRRRAATPYLRVCELPSSGVTLS